MSKDNTYVVTLDGKQIRTIKSPAVTAGPVRKHLIQNEGYDKKIVVTLMPE